MVQLCCSANLPLLMLLLHLLLRGPLISARCSFPPLSTCSSPVLHLLFMDWILKAPSRHRKSRVRLRFASASALRQDTTLQRPLRLPYVSPPLRRRSHRRLLLFSNLLQILEALILKPSVLLNTLGVLLCMYLPLTCLHVCVCMCVPACVCMFSCACFLYVCMCVLCSCVCAYPLCIPCMSANVYVCSCLCVHMSLVSFLCLHMGMCPVCVHMSLVCSLSAYVYVSSCLCVHVPCVCLVSAYVYVCSCVCVCVCSHIWVYACVPMCVYVSLWSQHYYLESVALRHLKSAFADLPSLAGQLVPDISASHPKCYNYREATMTFSTYMAAGDPNSSPHSCTTRTLSALSK